MVIPVVKNLKEGVTNFFESLPPFHGNTSCEEFKRGIDKNIQIFGLKVIVTNFFESLPPFHVKKICLGMLVFRQNIYLNFTSLQCIESFTTDTTILHISGNAVVQCNVSGHGMRIPRESVFAKIPNLGGIFGRIISTHFCNWVPCQCFLFNRPLFLKEN